MRGPRLTSSGNQDARQPMYAGPAGRGGRKAKRKGKAKRKAPPRFRGGGGPLHAAMVSAAT